MTELKDAREYLNGVEEIVEAKKDEVSEGGSVSDDDEEAWVMIPGMEAYKINPMENDFSPRVRNCYLVKKAKNADSATGESKAAEEPDMFLCFISACESYRFGNKDLPYLFG